FPGFFLKRMEPTLHGFLDYMEVQVEEEEPKFRGSVRNELPNPDWVPKSSPADSETQSDQ
ncbi:MAG: hypothetical protein ABEN55_20485, partial [Bradymonadaceae bacterium]